MGKEPWSPDTLPCFLDHSPNAEAGSSQWWLYCFADSHAFPSLSYVFDSHLTDPPRSASPLRMILLPTNSVIPELRYMVFHLHFVDVHAVQIPNTSSCQG
jgi:hypothetical protein